MALDYAQRFLFEQLDVRGRLVVLGESWRAMLAGRNYAPNIVALLGETVAVSVLLGAHRKGEHRITVQVRGNGPVSLLVADCDAELRIRGMATAAPGAQGNLRELFGDGRLALTLDDARSGQIYQSVVPLQGDTLAEVFQHYLSQSEQTLSFLQLHAGDHALCGLLLEKLPGADARDPDGWNRITQLAATLRLDEAARLSASNVLVRLFHEELLRVFPLDRIEYHCPHDVERVKNMLRGLGREEVESILAEQGEVLIRNEMCNHEYRFGAAEVADLFDQPDARVSH